MSFSHKKFETVPVCVIFQTSFSSLFWIPIIGLFASLSKPLLPPICHGIFPFIFTEFTKNFSHSEEGRPVPEGGEWAKNRPPRTEYAAAEEFGNSQMLLGMLQESGLPGHQLWPEEQSLRDGRRPVCRQWNGRTGWKWQRGECDFRSQNRIRKLKIFISMFYTVQKSCIDRSNTVFWSFLVCLYGMVCFTVGKWHVCESSNILVNFYGFPEHLPAVKLWYF